MKYVIVSVVVAMALIVAVVGGVGAQSNYQQFWSNVQMMYDLVVEDDVTIQGDLTVADDASIGGDLAVTGDSNYGIDQTINSYENTGMLPTVISADVEYTTTASLITIPDGEVWIIHDVLVNVTDNYDCTGDNCTFQLGDGGDPNGLVDLLDAEIQAADTEVTGGAAGWQGYLSGTRGAYLADGGGFVYAPSGAAETIDFAMGGTDPAGGAATVYVIYTRIK